MPRPLGTYGVQQVMIDSAPYYPVCMTCHFMTGASESGCYARLSNGNYGDTELRMTRREGDDSVTGCITSITPGHYTVSVYDIEDTGLISADTALFINDIEIFTSFNPVTMVTKEVVPSSTSKVLEATCELCDVTAMLRDVHVTIYSYCHRGNKPICCSVQKCR